MLKRIFRPSATNPSQRSLDVMFHKVTRVRVLDGGVSNGKAIGKDVLLDIADTQSIATLRDCLVIDEDRSIGHCMCLGDPAIEFYAGWRRTATIGIHHGRSIRWDAWKHDALLLDGRRLLTWLAEQGATAHLEAYEQDQVRAEEYRQAAIRWEQAMPTCLLPYWDQMRASGGRMATFIPIPQKGENHQGQMGASTGGIAPLLQTLETEYPDLELRVLELFMWYGSGKGPWNGYPEYENVAERLLLEFPTSQLITALDLHPLTPLHLEGAARYFAGYYFNTQKRNEAQQIPQELKRKLLSYSLLTSDEDKIRRAKKAFTN